MLHKTSCLIMWEKNCTSQMHIRMLQEFCVSKKCNKKRKKKRKWIFTTPQQTCASMKCSKENKFDNNTYVEEEKIDLKRRWKCQTKDKKNKEIRRCKKLWKK
jgi:hypothetical protein